MKLLYVDIARVIWLFDTRTVNPKGRDLKPLLGTLHERFGFAQMPAHPKDFKENALVFDAGAFVNSNGHSVAVSLKTYLDGFITETASNTTDTLEFVRQLLEAISDSGFNVPKDGTGEIGFLSQMRVSCDVPLLALNPKLDRVSHFLESHLNSMDGKPREFFAGGIHFFSEDVSKPRAPGAFKFERKYSIPFSRNEYYTQAPLQTDEHLELLEELEKILVS